MSGECVILLHILFILVTFTRACGAIETKNIKSPALDFSKHNIVQPTVHHGRTKREILSTRHASGGHHSEVQVTVPVYGEQWLLDLRLNEDLVAGGHTLQYQEGGKTVQHKPKKEELDLCHYSGSVRGKPQSWVAVSTCHGVRGVIFDGQRMLYIEPAQGPEIQSLHYLYDHKDFITKRSKESSHHAGQPEMVDSIGNGTNNNLAGRHRKQREIKGNRATRYKRESDNTQVREPFNANKSSRYVELLLVADYDEFRRRGHGDVRTMQSWLIELTNIINSIYVPLNIYIALVGVVVWNKGDQIRVTENGQKTLDDFLEYRKNKLVNEKLHDNAFLINPKKFDFTTVGMARPLSMCKLSSSGGIAVDHSDVIGLVAATIAHEIGHNFGMHHDETCATFECPDEQCIMTSTLTDMMPVHWSSCSMKALQAAFEKGQDYCLHNKPERLFDSPTCGNGFVEPGEQCDCGTVDQGDASPCRACCHSDTCRLRGNATCGAGACCDFATCQPKPAGSECRSADRECDLAEHCSGHSEYCPADVYKMDTTPCGVGEDQAYCVQGQCRSHAAQCRLLWGGARSHAACYSKNTEGTETGNCGHDSMDQPKQCAPEDAVCGLLQCQTENSTIVHAMGYGYDSHTDVSVTSYVQNRKRFDCYTAVFHLGQNNVDLGLVPDGAKCGDERMCLKQRCVSLAAVRAQISARESSACPSHCSGHGICNSEGHCHCDAGYAPPLCDGYGQGGSIDSGLANIKSNGRSVSYRPNTNPSGDSVNSRPYSKPSVGSVDYRPNTKSNDGSVNSRHYNKPSGGSVAYRPNANPDEGSVNSRPYNKPSAGSVDHIPNTRPNDGSINSRHYNKPSSGSVDYRPNTNPSGNSVNSRPYDKPSGGSVDHRPNTRPNDGSINSRHYNKPSSGSVDYRPNTNPSGNSVNPRLNNKPSDGSVDYRPNTNSNGNSVNSRPNKKPSDGPYDYRPNTNSDGGSVNSRPYNKPSGGSVDHRPNTRPNDGSINSRHYNKPSSGSVDYRPNTNPSGNSVNSRPYNEPSGGSVDHRPNTRPNDGSINSRHYNKPSGGSVDYRPNTTPSGNSANPSPNNKPSGGSVNYRPNTNSYSGSVNSRPNNKPSGGPFDYRPNTNTDGGAVNSRPYSKPSGGSIDYRPNINPNGGSVNSRPYHKPSGGSIDYRPNTNDNSGIDNSRPYNRPSGGSVDYRPNTNPHSGSVNSRPYSKPTDGSDDYRPNTKPSDGLVNSRPYNKPSGGSVYSSPNIESRTDWNDSKPTTEPSAQSIFVIAMYVIFLGIVPFMFLLLLIYYYTSHNVLWQQPKKLYTHYIAFCTKSNAKSNTMQTKKSNLDFIYQETDRNAKDNPTLAVESKLVKRERKITKDDIYIIPSDNKLDPVQPVSNINKGNIQIAIQDYRLKDVKPVLKPTIDDNSVATNEVKSKVVNAMKTSKDDIPIPTNGVRLKPVKPMATTDEKDIRHAIYNVKLKPVELKSKTAEDDTQVLINGVKLKPVRPLTNKPKPLTPKPEWLNDKPVGLIKPGTKLAPTKEMLNKGRLKNVGEENVKK